MFVTNLSLNEEAGYKSAQNWPNFSRFPRAGEPSMEAGDLREKKRVDRSFLY